MRVQGKIITVTGGGNGFDQELFLRTIVWILFVEYPRKAPPDNLQPNQIALTGLADFSSRIYNISRSTFLPPILHLPLENIDNEVQFRRI